MNAHDSDRMAEALKAHGWSAARHRDEADLIVINTCSVREKAEQKLRSEIGRLASLKARNPGLVLAVSGCVAQQEGEKLLAFAPHLDLVIGPDNIAELPALVFDQRLGAPARVRTAFDMDAPRFLAAIPSPGKAPVSAFVTTMKGCDERCSFCIVPHTRGPERYRSSREIVDEIARLVDSGTREVTLLGQTVNSFRDSALEGPSRPPAADCDESQFPELLRLIARHIPGLKRLRYASPHPRHTSQALARAHAEISILAHHVHLPVQSGSDRILKRMIRRYSRAEYITRARLLLSAHSDMTLSTDIIVGFPGETNADFEATLDLVREIGFVSLFGFKYSRRPFTPASRLHDDVPEETKSERLARLFELAEAQTQAHLATLVGTTQTVLVEGASKASATRDSGEVLVEGRTGRNEIVHIAQPNDRTIVPGAVAEVEIVRANKHSLVGVLERFQVDASSRRLEPEQQRRFLPILGAS